jgi:hypothetical protein
MESGHSCGRAKRRTTERDFVSNRWTAWLQVPTARRSPEGLASIAVTSDPIGRWRTVRPEERSMIATFDAAAVAK